MAQSTKRAETRLTQAQVSRPACTSCTTSSCWASTMACCWESIRPMKKAVSAICNVCEHTGYCVMYIALMAGDSVHVTCTWTPVWVCCAGSACKHHRQGVPDRQYAPRMHAVSSRWPSHLPSFQCSHSGTERWLK